MFDDLIRLKEVTGGRAAECDGGVECVLSKGAVMLAFSMHLLETVPGLTHVAIHPDGEHGKRFDIGGWLSRRGYSHSQPTGRTPYAGLYTLGGRSILVNPKSGVGDIVADHDGQSILAECKGGCVNTRHPGLRSRLRSGLCETVGLLLATPKPEGQRQYAVAPWADATAALAAKMMPRADRAGIEIVLLDEHGQVRA